jgi:hypothetical protein
MLQQYSGANAAQAPPTTTQDFQQVATVAPKSNVAEGIAEAFRSNQTPSFGSMLSGLFGQSNGQQQAGLLNTLLSSLGPGVLAGALSRAGAGNLAGMLNSGQQITPEQASQIPPEAIQQVATEAEKHNPNIVDQVSHFYAEHPTLVQTLGAGALAVVMGKMSNRI